jgi:hypothetical protein
MIYIEGTLIKDYNRYMNMKTVWFKIIGPLLYNKYGLQPFTKAHEKVR